MLAGDAQFIQYLKTGSMSIHKRRLQDHQYLKEMKTQARSKDSKKAEEARQGLALRKLSMEVERKLYEYSGAWRPREHSLTDHSIPASPPLLMEQLEHYFSGSPSHPERRARKTRNTAESDPASTEAIRRLSDDLRKRRPVEIAGCKHQTFSECLLARSGQKIEHPHAPRSAPFRNAGTFIPSRIPQPQQRDQSALEIQNEIWGKGFWLFSEQLRGLEGNTYQDAPVAVQRQLMKKALKPTLTLSFPEWEPFQAKGRGKYRVATGLPDSQITQNLVLCMGQVPDVVGGCGPNVTLHEHSDIDFHSLLCIKYDKEMQRRLKPPQEEIVDGVRVVRGFPMDFATRMAGAERFLAPMTFELYDLLEPHGSISRYRLAIHHSWTGGNVIEENPDHYTLENTYPKPLGHDWANVGCQIKFNKLRCPPSTPPAYSRLGARSP